MKNVVNRALMANFMISLLIVSIETSAKEHLELVPFGDFETWEVEKIKESNLIGGNTKSIYYIGDNSSPWGSSNAHAKVSGIDKVSTSVRKTKRAENDNCCFLSTKLEVVNAVGVINIKALATGSIYTGKMAKKIGMEQSKDPSSAIDMGIPFTKKPTALVMDYKAHIQDKQAIYANACLNTKKVEGKDKGQALVILQHRWEQDGHIYAYRVGTAHFFIENTDQWINDFHIPIEYGKVKNIQSYTELSQKRHKAKNSKDKMVYIEEKDWRGDLQPTHIIIQISSGSMDPFTGCPDNIVWCDNIKLAYEE